MAALYTNVFPEFETGPSASGLEGAPSTARNAIWVNYAKLSQIDRMLCEKS